MFKVRLEGPVTVIYDARRGNASRVACGVVYRDDVIVLGVNFHRESLRELDLLDNSATAAVVLSVPSREIGIRGETNHNVSACFWKVDNDLFS